MRRWLLLVLVLLLPLRGWIGEAMAGEMLARHIAVASAAAADGHHRQHAQGAHEGHDAHAQDHTHPRDHAQVPEPDCAGHAQAHGAAQAHADAQPQAQLPDAGCGTCASCQVCSSVALGFHLPALAVLDFGQAPPSVRLPHFASVEPRLGRKPPIS